MYSHTYRYPWEGVLFVSKHSRRGDLKFKSNKEFCIALYWYYINQRISKHFIKNYLSKLPNPRLPHPVAMQLYFLWLCFDFDGNLTTPKSFWVLSNSVIKWSNATSLYRLTRLKDGWIVIDATNGAYIWIISIVIKVILKTVHRKT